MSAAEPSPSPATTDEDLVGDRTRLLRIGMAAVFAACVVFAILRFVVEWQTGKLTPWWGNAIGAVGIGLLYLWVRGDTARRSSVAVHGTALLATVALLAPAAYGMASSKWWLALVGFSVTLMGRRREVLVWAGITIVLIPTVALIEPSIQMPNAAGEPAAERAFAGAMFIVLLLAITAAFRRVADQRARDLVETAARLERAVATRSRFLANMSHEIRNPLHGVIAMTDLALTGEASDTVRRQIEAAQQSARALLNILNNILDVSRAEADALEIEARPFHLHESLVVGLKPLAAQAIAKGLRFEATAAPNIPAKRLGDGVRFSQIVANLVTNALKFTTRGSIAVELRSPGPDRIEVEIRDTGIGIPADKVDTIFEPFVQVGSEDARNQSGVGLGLAIVRELVRRMDGTIVVKSQVDQGTRITVNVRMPVAPGGGAAGPTTLWTEVVAAAPRQSAGGRSLSILICEDHVMNQKVLTAMLRGLGHRAKVTANGVEALEALARDRYDLLITDLEMPTMDGLELTRQIRAREATEKSARLPVIGATAHVGVESKHRLLDAGIDAHLPKPFSLHDLSSTIAAVMGSDAEAPAQDATAS